MKAKIKLDIVSDVVCPWCIIGYKRLEQAIDELGIKDDVEIEWHPFELNPSMEQEGEELREHLNKKYGTSVEDGKRTEAYLIKLGAELDFEFNFFDGMRIYNTRDAHVLIEKAREQGKQNELNLRLVQAYFSEQKDVSDRDLLLTEAESLGLDRSTMEAELQNEEAREKLLDRESQWRTRGVNAVPTLVFNGKGAVSGAQSVASYKQILAQLMAK